MPTVNPVDASKVQSVDINATADGDNTIIVAPGAGKKLLILAMVLTAATTAGAVLFKSAAGNVRGRANLAIGTPLDLPIQDASGLQIPWIECGANEAFIINNAVGVDVLGYALYMTVDA